MMFLAECRHLLPLLGLLWTVFAGPAQADEVRVAAAADLTHALPVLAERFRAATGHGLRISYGASGYLARQIAQGAPFEILFSANEDYVSGLARQGLTLDEGTIYARGRLVLFVPAGSPVVLSADLSSLDQALRSGSLRRLAIANPAHAPYGVAAREALRRAGLWQAVQPTLVLGENAAQTAQFSASGSAEAGLIPEAIAVAPAFAGRGRYVPVAERLYTPLRQRMVLLKGAGTAARALFDFMMGLEAKAILAYYGFGL